MTPTDPRARVVAALEKIEATKVAKTPGRWEQDHDTEFPSAPTNVYQRASNDFGDAWPIVAANVRPWNAEAIVLAHGVTFGTGSEPGPVETILREALRFYPEVDGDDDTLRAFTNGLLKAALLLADHINEGETPR